MGLAAQIAFALQLAAGPRTGAAHVLSARSKGTFPQPRTLPPSSNCKLRKPWEEEGIFGRLKGSYWHAATLCPALPVGKQLH